MLPIKQRTQWTFKLIFQQNLLKQLIHHQFCSDTILIPLLALKRFRSFDSEISFLLCLCFVSPSRSLTHVRCAMRNDSSCSSYLPVSQTKEMFLFPVSSWPPAFFCALLWRGARLIIQRRMMKLEKQFLSLDMVKEGKFGYTETGTISLYSGEQINMHTLHLISCCGSAYIPSPNAIMGPDFRMLLSWNNVKRKEF